MPLPISKAFYKQCGLHLVEPLGSNLKIGTVGYSDGSQWVRLGTTKSFFGFDLATEPGTTNLNSFDMKSKSGITAKVLAEGETGELVTKAASAKARLEVQFKKSESFAGNIVNQSVVTATDLAVLIQWIRWAYHYRSQLPATRAWEKNYCVVTAVATAESVVALSARSTNAGVVIEGRGELAAPATLGEVSAEMKFSLDKEAVSKLIVTGAAGYAYQAMRINPRMFTHWEREDVTNRDLADAAFDAAALPAPKRPKDISAWMKSSGLATTRSTIVELVGPTRTPATKGTVGELKKATKQLNKPPK